MRHSSIALAVVVLAGVVPPVLAPGVALAQAKDDDCQALDTGFIPNPAQAACDVGEAVIDQGPVGAAQEAIAAPVKAAGDEVMKGVTTWVANGASWLVGQAGRLIDATTTPRVTSPWFTRQYEGMGRLAVVFALPLLLLAVMQGVLRRDGQLIMRAAAVNLPLAFLLTAMAVTVVELLLQITDQMSAQIAGSAGDDAREFFKDTAKSLGLVIAATGGNPVPLFAVFLGALIAAVGAFFVWVELLLRSAAIYVAVLFLPLTFVATIWPATARWCRRLVELLIAIILSKFVIVAIMALAAAGLGQSRGEDAFQGVLAGAALMLLAAFSPFALLKLIPLAESAVESARYRAGVGSSTLSPVASPGLVMRRVLDGNWGSGGGGLRATPAAGGARAMGTAGAGPAAMAGAAGAQAAGAAVRSRAENIGAAGSANAGARSNSGRPDSASSGGAPPPAAGAPAESGATAGSASRGPSSPARHPAGDAPGASPERRDRPLEPGPSRPRRSDDGQEGGRRDG